MRTLPIDVLSVLFEILMGTRTDESHLGEFAFSNLMSESMVCLIVSICCGSDS